MAKVDAGGKPAKGGHKAGRVEAFPAKKARKKAEDLGGLTDLNDVFAAFQDPKQEWRRLVAELVGTFFLVLVAAGGPMMAAAIPGSVGRVAAVVAPGLMVMAVIMALGKISGAHLNPGVSTAFALRGDFPWRRVPGYLVAQLLGAILAALLLTAVVGVSSSHGSTYVAHVRAGQHHSWHRLWRAERGDRGCDRRGWLHCACGPVGQPNLGCVHELRSHFRAQPGRW